MKTKSPYANVMLNGTCTGDGTGIKLCLDQTLNQASGHAVHRLDMESFHDVVPRAMHFKQCDERAEEKRCMSALPRVTTPKSLVWKECMHAPAFSELHRRLASSSHVSFFMATTAHTPIEMHSEGLPGRMGMNRKTAGGVAADERTKKGAGCSGMHACCTCVWPKTFLTSTHLNLNL